MAMSVHVVPAAAAGCNIAAIKRPGTDLPACLVPWFSGRTLLDGELPVTVENHTMNCYQKLPGA